MRRVFGWGVVGVLGSGLELLLLSFLKEVLTLPLPVASAIAAEVLILGKFLATDRFVFGYPSPGWRRLIKYHGASAGALVVYWLVINGLSLLADVPYVVSFVVGTGAAFVWSLATNFLWVWAHAR